MGGFTACTLQTEPSHIDVLRVSVQPHRDTERLKDFYQPLMRYLEQELNVKVQWVSVADYQQQLDQFHNGEVDLTLFGGYAFIKALEKDKADPLVMRDIDFRFTSYFLVANNNIASKVSELKGQSFSFGSKLSTSGHIMPRFFLSTQGIVPETFFSEVLYSNAHDTTFQLVQDGIVDVGVANSVLIDQLLKETKTGRNNVKILSETPPYPNYVWAARNGLPETLKTNIIEAFIKLSIDDKEDSKLLQKMGVNHYFPANSDDFEPIRKISHQLDMLKT